MTTTPLDVLIIESHPGLGSGAATDLVEAGHRVHYCHDGFDHGFRCRGLQEPSTCPIEDHVDVALSVRGGISPRPSSLEDGARCAIRAHVPLVEQGPEMLDPFAPWVAERIEAGADVEAACLRTAATTHRELQEQIRLRIAGLLAAAMIDPDDVRYRFENGGPLLTVTLVLPVEVSHRVQQALAVRVLDAIKGAHRTYGKVGVNVTSSSSHPDA